MVRLRRHRDAVLDAARLDRFLALARPRVLVGREARALALAVLVDPTRAPALTVLARHPSSATFPRTRDVDCANPDRSVAAPPRATSASEPPDEVTSALQQRP